MENDTVRYTIRVDSLLLEKIRYVAADECRSVNKEIEQCMKKRVYEYERENGKIEVSND